MLFAFVSDLIISGVPSGVYLCLRLISVNIFCALCAIVSDLIIPGVLPGVLVCPILKFDNIGCALWCACAL